MKKLIYLVCLCVMVSCGDNEDNNVDVNESDIVGTWNLTKMETNATTTMDTGIIDINFDTKVYGKDYDYTITFSEDPNEITTDGSFTTVIEYDGDDTFGDIDFSEFGVEDQTFDVSELITGTWSISDDILTCGTSSQTSDMTIDSFSDTKLVLKSSTEENFSIEGYSYKITTETEVILER